MFKASVMLEQIKKLQPQIAKIAEDFDFTDSDSIPFTEFDKMPSISIDYAVMEKSDKIALVKLESDWNDLGSWQSIYDISPKDDDGNVFIGHVLDKGSKNSFVEAYKTERSMALRAVELINIVKKSTKKHTHSINKSRGRVEKYAKIGAKASPS